MTSVARKAKKGAGKSRIDNMSAAATHFMIPRDLSNPFHHPIIRRERQSWAKVASLVDEVKKKAGEC